MLFSAHFWNCEPQNEFGRTNCKALVQNLYLAWMQDSPKMDYWGAHLLSTKGLPYNSSNKSKSTNLYTTQPRQFNRLTNCETTQWMPKTTQSIKLATWISQSPTRTNCGFSHKHNSGVMNIILRLALTASYPGLHEDGANHSSQHCMGLSSITSLHRSPCKK